MTLTHTILETCSEIDGYFTPIQIYRILLRKGVSIKKGTVKRVLYRLWRRGILSRRGIYFFADEGDSINHLRGQKGTAEGGINHLKNPLRSKYKKRKRGHKNDLSGINHSSKNGVITRRVCAILYNHKDGIFTIKDLQRILSQSDLGKVNYRSVQSALRYLQKRGIVKKIQRGVYRIGNTDRAFAYLTGRDTPQGSSEGTGSRPVSLPAISIHRGRIGMIYLERGQFEGLKSRKSSVCPLYIIKPPRERDRARQWTFETENLIISVSERTLKAQIFKKGPEWEKDLVDLLGAGVLNKLEGAKITAHAAVNLKELVGFKVRVGDIQIEIDKSQFGEDLDLEFQGEEDKVIAALKSAISNAIVGTDLHETIKNLTRLIRYYHDEVVSIKQEVNHLLNGGAGVYDFHEFKKRLDEVCEKVDTIEKAQYLLIKRLYPELGMKDPEGGMYA